MHLTRLSLTDFRSYAGVELSLEPGVSTFLGPNGQGKTNLVEAAAYVATLGSHRVATDAPLVRAGAERAILRAAVTSGDTGRLVEIEINPGRANRARLNRAPVSRPRQVLGVLRTVLFAPEDLALVKGDPEQRRRFLDDLLVASAPRYAGVRADYERVLRQRTALLKSLRGRPVRPGRPPAYARAGRPQQGGAGQAGEPADGGPGHDGASQNGSGQDGQAGPATQDGPEDQGGRSWPAGQAASTLDVWDEHLATAGAELLAARLRLTASLRPLVARSYSAVSGGAAVEAGISYRQSLRTSGSGPAGPPPSRPSPPSRPPMPPSSRTACGRRWPGCAARSWNAGCAWPARTATTWTCGSASCPPGGMPATANPGRWRSRSAWPRSRRCAAPGTTRCCCSTTCSPSSTRAAGNGWPAWSRARSRCW